ncbi:MAG: hypothetical protein ACYDHE_17140 [Candidatus Acidiferrales bacterium]
MPRVERTGPRAPTLLTLEPMIRENIPDSRVIVTLSRESTGLNAGDVVMMSTNLGEVAARTMLERLYRAVVDTWGPLNPEECEFCGTAFAG